LVGCATSYSSSSVSPRLSKRFAETDIPEVEIVNACHNRIAESVTDPCVDYEEMGVKPGKTGQQTSRYLDKKWAVLGI
jgi:hypothetical protein